MINEINFVTITLILLFKEMLLSAYIIFDYIEFGQRGSRAGYVARGGGATWKVVRKKLVKYSAQHGWARKKILYFASFQVIPRSHLIFKIKHLSKIHNCHQFNFKTFQIPSYVNICRHNVILIEILKYHSLLKEIDFVGLWFD